MKRIFMLIVVVIGYLFASCSNISSDRNAGTACGGDNKCIIDSLIGVIDSLDSIVVGDIPPPDSIGVVPELDSVLITSQTADTLTNAWQTFSQKNNTVIDTIFSYMIDANILRDYVLNDTSVKYLDVYMGLSNRKLPFPISLVYVGAKQITSTIPGVDSFQEVPFQYGNAGKSPTPQLYVFDRCIPCPTCDVAGFSKIAIITNPIPKPAPITKAQKNKK